MQFSRYPTSLSNALFVEKSFTKTPSMYLAAPLYVIPKTFLTTTRTSFKSPSYTPTTLSQISQHRVNRELITAQVVPFNFYDFVVLVRKPRHRDTATPARRALRDKIGSVTHRTTTTGCTRERAWSCLIWWELQFLSHLCCETVASRGTCYILAAGTLLPNKERKTQIISWGRHFPSRCLWCAI